VFPRAILVASSRKGVVSILIDDEPDELVRTLQDRFPNAQLVGADKEYEQLVARVVAWSNRRESMSTCLWMSAEPYSAKVWQALRKIPAGRTASYADVARRIGAPKAVRAVAGACAANHIAVAIPCHRVIRTDGGRVRLSLGFERRHALLERESATA